MPPDSDSFDGGPSSGADAARPSVDQDVLWLVSTEMATYLQSRIRGAYPNLSRLDVEDIVANVLAKQLDRLRAGKWVPEGDISQVRSYLVNAAKWAVLDFYRSARWTHETLSANENLRDLVLTDDGTVAALEQTLATEEVRAALRHVQRDGDTTLFQVVTYLLDTLQCSGRRPSNRETANACGMSHTAVANALVRLRPYFEKARDTAR